MIYLDHNSTTCVYPEAIEIVNECLCNCWGNPASPYSFGVKAKRVVEHSRNQIATLCGALPEQVIFTSGATESNNSILSASLLKETKPNHIITSKAEHSSILNCCLHLSEQGRANTTTLDVDQNGLISLEQLKVLLKQEISLVSLMWVNNETGVVSQIEEISNLCKEAKVKFHTDAVQAIGKIPIHFEASGIDYLSLSGHKIGAPKGIGAMLIREPENFMPLMRGGKQENGLRAGTENVAYIAALGKAAEIEFSIQTKKQQKLKELLNHFEQGLKNAIPASVINGGQTQRVSNTSNFHIPGIDGDAAITFLQTKDIFASTGSACLEQAITPSHVILAMTGSHDIANESIRISLGHNNTFDQIDTVIKAIVEFEKFTS